MLKLNSKIIFLLLFCGICISIIIYQDYGISIDEKHNRFYGIVNFKFFLDFFNLKYPADLNLESVQNLNNYPDKFYGAFYEMINFVFIEVILKKNDIQEIYYIRHLINHLLFLTSLFFYYKTLNIIFNKNVYAILGVIALYSTPRIFADSFYNGKDLAFLSIFLISCYFAIKCIQKFKYKNLIILSFFSAFSMNLRLIGLYLPLVLTLFLLLENKINKKKIFYTLLLPFLFFFIITPFLWTDTLNNFFLMIKNSMSFKRMENFYVYFLGSYHKTKYLPEIYLPISFLVTSPILPSLLGIGGLIIILKKFLKRLFYIDETYSNKDIWKSKYEKLILFNFLVFVTPLFFFYVLNSIIYNGWRHFFFLYPMFLTISIYFLRSLIQKFKKNNIFIILIFLLFLIENIIGLIKFHPFQFIYFNPLIANKANRLFEIDYWGVANSYTLNKTFKLENSVNGNKIKIANASFTDLILTYSILKPDLQKKLTFVGQDYSNSDFIFTNSIYEINPKYDTKYKIPSNYTKFFELTKGGIIINQIYKKNNSK